MKPLAAERVLRQVVHRFEPPLLAGRLVRRYKRFLAEVDLEGLGRTEVHCPNSGSMLGALQKGAPVYCSPAARPGRRTAFTWEMIKMGRHWVGINTALPNRLLAQAARRQALPLFVGAREVIREVPCGHSRLDLMVRTPGGELYVEVKNVTLVRRGRAEFPDAVTARGARHLDELIALRRQGKGAAMIYLVQRGDGRSFGPAADIDPAYAKAYRQAKRAGVELYAVLARVSPRCIRLWRLLPLCL